MKDRKLKLEKAIKSDETSRKKVAASWGKKLDDLKKKEGKTRTAFYAENGLNQYMMIRYIKGDKVASWELIDKVEKAFMKQPPRQKAQTWKA